MKIILSGKYLYNPIFTLLIVKEYLVTLTMAVSFVLILKRDILTLIKIEILALVLYLVGLVIAPFDENIKDVLFASIIASAVSFLYAARKIKLVI